MEYIILLLILIWLALLYVLLSMLSNVNNMNNNVTKSENKPYMWSYWQLMNGTAQPPSYITLCFDIMKRNSAKYFTLIILNEKSVFEYLPDLRKDIDDLPIALKVDYIRIKLLHKYGGLWIDADTIMMTDLKTIADALHNGIDFIGVGCTGGVCKNTDGYGRPSNGVIGSTKNGLLINHCLDNLNKKLDLYYLTDKAKRVDFDYFDLGKKIIWEEYDKLMQTNRNYKYYHLPSYADGTRDINGHWVAPNLIFPNHIELLDKDRLEVVMLANSEYCGSNPKYNWFCKLPYDEVLNGKYFVSSLFRSALTYNK
jgi:hypothetical protein